MIAGLGTDVIEIDRVKESYHRHRERIAKRILSPEEYDQFVGFSSERKVEFLAGRFAAKEAIAKAAGCGLARLHMSSVDITLGPKGLTIRFLGQAEPYHEGNWIVSISHSTTQAFAVALWES